MELTFIEKMLWWQKRNLSYTKSGFGKKIPTQHMARYENRLYRVYCCIYSNSGTLYIKTKQGDITISRKTETTI
jgi:hypothetical protein